MTNTEGNQLNYGPSVCVADTKLKDAAIYFNYVIPISLEEEYDADPAVFERLPLSQLDQNILPPNLRPHAEILRKLELLEFFFAGLESREAISRWNDELHTMFLGSVKALDNQLDAWNSIDPGVPKGSFFEYFPKNPHRFIELVASGELNETINILNDLARAMYQHFVLLGTDGFRVETLVRFGPNLNRENVTPHPSITLSDVSLIDTSKLDWEVIMELRKDEASTKKLRNLKLFLTTEYHDQQQNVDFIRDDLSRRIEEFEATTRSWGLETAKQSLTQVASSKSLLATSGAIAAAILLGQPWAAAAVGLPLTILELGQVGVHIASRRAELMQIKDREPTAFIIETRARAE